MNPLLAPFRIPASRWCCALAGVWLLCPTIRAEEKSNNLLTSLSSTTINGYVNTSMTWDLGAADSVPEPAAGALLFAGAAILILVQAGRGRNRPAGACSKGYDR